MIFLLSSCSFQVYGGRLGSFWFFWEPFTCPWELLLINLNVAKIAGRLYFLFFSIFFLFFLSFIFLFNFLCIFMGCSITVIHI